MIERGIEANVTEGGKVLRPGKRVDCVVLQSNRPCEETRNIEAAQTQIVVPGQEKVSRDCIAVWRCRVGRPRALKGKTCAN